MPAIDGNFRHPLSWRSRIFRATAAAILLVLAVRLVWGWQTHRALSAKLADLRRQGQPVDAADAVYEHVPDAANAWQYQSKAAAAIVAGVDSPSASNLTYNDYPPFPPAWWQLAEASEKAHGRVFALARQARQYSRVQFRDRLPSPVFSALMPNLTASRHLALTVADGALYAHLKGNDPEALERAMDVLHVARSLRQDDLVVSQLVAIAVEALALDRIQVMAPGLRLGEGEAKAAATRDRVRELIRELLDEELAWRGVTAALGMERLVTIDSLHMAAGATWFIRPLAERQALRDLGDIETSIAASRLRTKPQIEAALAGLGPDVEDPTYAAVMLGSRPATVPRYSRWFFLGTTRWTSRYMETALRVISERRATAVSLAAQSYRADHGGAWPGRLADLVPAYLPTLPADPYHDDGRTLGYVVAHRPDGTPRPLVYFDAGATENVEINPARPMYGWQEEHRPNNAIRDLRQYRDLSRFAPGTAPRPSAKAVDDDPEKSDAPGDEAKKQDQAEEP